MTNSHLDLEPIDPSTVRELYLEYKKTYCSEATVKAHHYRTKHIVNWCEEESIDNRSEAGKLEQRRGYLDNI